MSQASTALSAAKILGDLSSFNLGSDFGPWIALVGLDISTVQWHSSQWANFFIIFKLGIIFDIVLLLSYHLSPMVHLTLHQPAPTKFLGSL